jgi:hypothetical protein|tara:strand:- start:304 stop:549 length:246 start_codon:yes stop_codon:yes gene_type:complete
MASEGETKTRFGRQFTFINPNDALGPGTWRLSSIDEIASQGGGGGGGTVNDVSGVVPITSTTVGAGEIDISIDISNLPEKT